MELLTQEKFIADLKKQNKEFSEELEELRSKNMELEEEREHKEKKAKVSNFAKETSNPSESLKKAIEEKTDLETELEELKTKLR